MVDILSEAYKIHIKGIVQGVGFRPFVFKLAQELSVSGWVNNTSDGVCIHVEGNQVEVFYQRLLIEKPPLAYIFSIEKKEIPIQHYDNFYIAESKQSHNNDMIISTVLQQLLN